MKKFLILSIVLLTFSLNNNMETKAGATDCVFLPIYWDTVFEDLHNPIPGSPVFEWDHDTIWANFCKFEIQFPPVFDHEHILHGNGIERVVPHSHIIA